MVYDIFVLFFSFERGEERERERVCVCVEDKQEGSKAFL